MCQSESQILKLYTFMFPIPLFVLYTLFRINKHKGLKSSQANIYSQNINLLKMPRPKYHIYHTYFKEYMLPVGQSTENFIQYKNVLISWLYNVKHIIHFFNLIGIL